MEYYSTMEKEIQPVPATWMEFEGIKLSELSQTEKYKYCIMSLICDIWKNKKRHHRHGEKIGSYQKWGDSLMAQTVKSLPAIRETWVWSLGLENPMEKEKVTYSSITT